MFDKVGEVSGDMLFSRVKPMDTVFRGDGLRDFFLYRDLGVAAATGWRRHEADFHVLIMLRGRARFMDENQETLVSAGDCVHQRPGVRHHLFDDSPDMAYLEVVGPADFKSIDVAPVCEIPAAQGWAI